MHIILLLKKTPLRKQLLLITLTQRINLVAVQKAGGKVTIPIHSVLSTT